MPGIASKADANNQIAEGTGTGEACSVPVIPASTDNVSEPSGVRVKLNACEFCKKAVPKTAVEAWI